MSVDSFNLVTGLPSLSASLGDIQEIPESDGGESLAFFNFLINVCIDGFLCLFGYMGNILIILVFHFDRVRTSNTILLQALAFFDSMFLTYAVLYVVLRSVYPYTGMFKVYADINPYIVAFGLPFCWTSQTCTIWTVMVIAIDRYIVVSRPLKAAVWCTVKNAKRAVVAVTIASILFNLPRWPCYYIVAFNSQWNNGSIFVSHMSFQSDYWNEELYRQVYHVSLTFVFLFIIPLSFLVVLNARLILAIKTAMKRRQLMTQQSIKHAEQGASDKASTSVTIMMIVVITVFIICQLPDFIASIIGAGKFSVNTIVYSYYAGIKEMFLIFNSCVNFAIYCIFQKRFRATLARMFGFTGSTPQTEGHTSATILSKTSSLNSIDTEANNINF